MRRCAVGIREVGVMVQGKEIEIIQCSLELQIEADNNTESLTWGKKTTS